MRELSTRMIEAVLDGEGLQGVADLAAAEAGGPVAILLPPRGLAARAPEAGEIHCPPRPGPYCGSQPVGWASGRLNSTA